MVNKVESWLDDFKGKTREDYRSRMLKFFAETQTSEEKLDSMSAIEIKHLAIQWRNKKLEEGVPQNSTLAILSAVRSYCSSDYVNKPLKFKKGQLGKVQADNHSHVYSTNDIRGMFEVSDVFEKALLSTAVSLGWEVSSFRNLDKEKIKNLIERAKANNENFVFFEDIRKKEGEPRLGILNPLAVQWLTRYFEINQDKSTRLFQVSKAGVGKMLRRLARESAIKPTGELRFHRLRAWLESSLSRAGFNAFQISFIMGHALPTRDRGYLLTLKNEIEEKYPKVYEQYLNITYSGNGETKSKVTMLELENKELKQTVGELTQKVKTLEDDRQLTTRDMQLIRGLTAEDIKNIQSLRKTHETVS